MSAERGRYRAPSDEGSDLAVLTPSFRGDAKLFEDLHESVLANTDPSVVHHVVVPPSDARAFRHYDGDRCHIWTHRDILPRHYVSVPHADGLTLNVRRPWLPVRGWVVQQIMKIAGTAATDARAVLVVDSDAMLLRRLTLDELTHEGKLWHFRKEDAVTAAMDRHLLWHKVARRLLDLPDDVRAPAPDYVSPIAVWDPAIVRALTAHIEHVTGRNWIDVIAGELHISEFVLYGVFVDYVLDGIASFDGPLCHNYYDRVPLSATDARAFADRMPAGGLGAMISSHSATPRDVRREAFRCCAQRIGRNGLLPHESAGWPSAVRGSFERRCLDAAMVLVQLIASAPAV